MPRHCSSRANCGKQLPHPGVNEIGPTAAVAENQIIGTAGVLNPRRYKLGASNWQNAAGLHASPQEACYATLAAGKRLALLSDCEAIELHAAA
jgi:hypothetical protein